MTTEDEKSRRLSEEDREKSRAKGVPQNVHDFAGQEQERTRVVMMV